MNYLVLPETLDPFYTNWFDAENNFVDGMVVFNLLNHTYTTDGINWYKVKQDHL